jgi:5-methylcytosine-specific restriction endonuclease McrA
MTLHYNDDGAFSVDHVVPLAEGGDPEDLANCRPAHRGCNVAKGTNQNYQAEKPKGSQIW